MSDLRFLGHDLIFVSTKPAAAHTAYKRDALAFLSDHFRWDDATPVGELELVNNGETVEGTLILMSEWKAKLPAHL